MEVFRRTLEDFQLVDICFFGPCFIWERGRVLENNIRERIDRGVATDAWVQLFPSYSLRHIPHSFLDHCPFAYRDGGRRNEQ